MRIGVYGGTFDPVHWGHLILAEQCREQLALDEVWFIPAGEPPHKLAGDRTPGRQRQEMLELALAGHPAFKLSEIELQRPGPSFTVETLEELHRRHPEHQWWLLLGADALRDFPGWRQPERIAQLARIAAVNRHLVIPHAGIMSDPHRLPPHDVTAFQQRFGERLDVVCMPPVGLSASDIRQRAAQGRSIRYLVPRAVEMYILQHGLYRSDQTEVSS
ncbi:MAG: putative nicotinate-nucleotide adenylyltransferase [Planctomycetaceae bacterium]|nr:MAG: putative nicotinate-nucleotide adenylyltransferase [Planctomycetaceae bacterium]